MPSAPVQAPGVQGSAEAAGVVTTISAATTLNRPTMTLAASLPEEIPCFTTAAFPNSRRS
jgi:hypothetical protein